MSSCIVCQMIVSKKTAGFSTMTFCTVPGGLLNIGAYIVCVGGGIPSVKVLLPINEHLTFSTAGCGNQGSNYPEKWPGVVCPTLDWVIERMS